MRQLLTVFVLLLIANIISAQAFRYSHKIFERTDTLKNIEYATANWLNNPIALFPEYNIHNGENKTEERALLMDIFTPRGDTLTKRPVILFAHSGGFLLGSNQNDDMIAFCDSFALKGYVTATIGYRIGMGADISTIFGFPVHMSLTKKNAARAAYRALQDSRAAIRFLKHNAENFGIDTTKIYVAGSSAGGFVALHNMYMDRANEIPESVFLAPSLGNLDTVGIQGYGGQANAIVSLWGALEKPELIENETKPVLLVHGEDDDVVYFKKGMPLKTLVPENDAIDFSIPETYGSFCVDTALINLNIQHETYFVPGKKHEFYGVATGMFGDDGPNEYWDTIQWKISDFLFDIFKPDADFHFEASGATIRCFDVSEESIFSEWDFGDNNGAQGAQVSHTYSEAGNYKIKLTTCNENLACDTITKIVSIAPVSVKNDLRNSVLIYPNPVQEIIYIQGIHSSYKATIYDLEGRVIKTLEYSGHNQINISELERGIYILSLEYKQTKIFRKFLKQK